MDERAGQIKEGPMEQYQMYIDGKMCDARDGARLESINPATEEKISRLVPDVYPSRSELIRSLVRDEIERIERRNK
jgi:acyl-CoA reductase-like NAD-dependent aldehyde dehydrogenase